MEVGITLGLEMTMLVEWFVPTRFSQETRTIYIFLLIIGVGFMSCAQPKNSTIKSLGRAFKSMGSIAFGSLIVTILEMLRLLLDAIRNNANADGQRTFDNPVPHQTYYYANRPIGLII